MSLMELLLAMSLSLLILILLTSVYLMLAQQRQQQVDLIIVQDNLRTALQILRSDIQAAGYSGCARSYPDFSWGSTPILHLNQTQTVVQLWYRDYQADAVLELSKQTNHLEVSSEVKMNPNDMVLISDCRHAELFQVIHVSEKSGRQKLVSSLPLKYAYGEDAELGLMKLNTYSVEETGRHDAQGQSIRALYLSSTWGAKQELVEGIEKMTLRSVLNDQGKQAVSLQLEARQGKLHKRVFAFIRLKQYSPLPMRFLHGKRGWGGG